MAIFISVCWRKSPLVHRLSNRWRSHPLLALLLFRSRHHDVSAQKISSTRQSKAAAAASGETLLQKRLVNPSAARRTYKHTGVLLVFSLQSAFWWACMHFAAVAFKRARACAHSKCVLRDKTHCNGVRRRVGPFEMEPSSPWSGNSSWFYWFGLARKLLSDFRMRNWEQVFSAASQVKLDGRKIF